MLDDFRENVAYIGQLQTRGEIVTLPLRELRKALTNHACRRATRTEDGWELECDAVVCSHSPYSIAGQAMKRNHNEVFSAEVRGRALLQGLRWSR